MMAIFMKLAKIYRYKCKTAYIAFLRVHYEQLKLAKMEFMCININNKQFLHFNNHTKPHAILRQK